MVAFEEQEEIQTFHESDWVLIDEGTMKGVNIVVDHATSEVIRLSTKDCKDADRWMDMPSLECFPSLEYVDLHNSRYITDLHESIVGLVDLKRLSLTRCLSLERLPSAIGRLRNLQEVRIAFRTRV